jgi:hypothetical protein
MGKAKWDIIWIQLIVYAIISALFTIIGAIGVNINDAVNTTLANANTSGLTPVGIHELHTIFTFAYQSAIYGQIIITPVSLLASVGILYLLAKAFGGTGTFLTQLYCSLLFLVPLGIVGGFVILLLSYLPAGGVFSLLIAVARFVYQSILFGFLLIPVHRISGGRATSAILLLYGVMLLLLCVSAIFLAAFLSASAG